MKSEIRWRERGGGRERERESGLSNTPAALSVLSILVELFHDKKVLAKNYTF
jgi:hypothetical protein